MISFREHRFTILAMVFVALVFRNTLNTSISSVLPHIVKETFGDNDTATNATSYYADEKSYRRVNLEAGIIWGVSSTTQLLVALPTSAAVKRFGQKPLLLLGGLCSMLATVSFAFSANFWLLVLNRVAQGMGGLIVEVAGLSLLAEIQVDRKGRWQSGGIATAGQAVGDLFGFAWSNCMLNIIGRMWLFLSIGSIGLIDLLMRFTIKKPSQNDENQTKEDEKKSIDFRCVLKLLADREMLAVYTSMFMRRLSIGVMWSTEVAWLLRRFSPPQWRIGLNFIVASVVQIVLNLVTGYLGAYLPSWVVCMIGLQICGAGLAMMPVCPSMWAVMGIESAIRCGRAILTCANVPMLADIVRKRHSASEHSYAYGLYSMFGLLGFACGAFSAGPLVSVLPFQWVYCGFGGLIFVSSFLTFMLKSNDDCGEEVEEGKKAGSVV